MNFNWKKFMDKNNKIVVHCKTEEEAFDFCKQMDEHGLTWCNDERYLENFWNTYKEQTLYSNHGTFGTKKGYDDSWSFLEWSDYMVKYPIDYLKYGYVVEFKNGKLAMYMPSQDSDCFDLADYLSCYYLKDFNNKKELKFNNDIYVIKFYGYSQDGSSSRELSIARRYLIWERPKEVKKMTVSEICKELGYKVEIIAEEK